MIDHTPQCLHPIVQINLAVFLEEEHGVAQPGPQDAFVALPNNVGIAGQRIINCDEMGHQLAAAIPQGEIPLVLPHRGDEHVIRQSQELFLEIPQSEVWVFNEKGILLQQLRVGHDLPLNRGRGLLQLLQ